jgi:hypothetical protein
VNAPLYGGSDPLAKVCSLLNRHHARYLIVGGHACVLHGLIRTTEDVDILIDDAEDNFPLVIAALSGLEDHAAAELTPRDLKENAVVKVADEVEVDISRRAWKVPYAEAVSSALQTEVDGVVIPYVSLEILLKTKETFRDRDQSDRDLLIRLAQRKSPDFKEPPRSFFSFFRRLLRRR